MTISCFVFLTMGHSNLAITMKVYNHVDDKRMPDEIENVAVDNFGRNCYNRIDAEENL